MSSMYFRRNSAAVNVGNVAVGGHSPIVVQSMTNTDTADVEKTVAQVTSLYEAGSEIVRITVNNKDAAKAVPIIREKLYQAGLNVPLVGDFHFNGSRLLKKYTECAKALDKYRILNMYWQDKFTVQSSGRGTYEITNNVEEMIRNSGVQQGLCHLFIRHTSASLIISENAR